MKILFLTLYPGLQPSTRFRILQFLPYLGPDTKYAIRPVVPEWVFRRFYGKKSFIEKAVFHLFEFFTRLKDIVFSFKYDVVFLQKSIATINYRGLHCLLSLFSKNLIVDFDDAVTISPVTEVKLFPWVIFQDRKQIYKIVSLAKAVIVGNQRLSDDISEFNRNIFIIPTPVDTEYWSVNADKYRKKDVINILWSGNQSGHELLKICYPALLKLRERRSFKIVILSDGDSSMVRKFLPEIDFNFIKWDTKTEKKVFFDADIGIMPVYDTLWNRRKCAFKALLYMASGIPVVSSPVGVVTSFIKDSENGFIANTSQDWENKLEKLILSESLRKTVGLSGRDTVENSFSLIKNALLWKQVINGGILKENK
ncbi:MAG: glycosyltransferase [Candidatus Omnitrophica bacterium]|nr:glycosyltransferase [Candidatus Omnitrophota bacterium]